MQATVLRSTIAKQSTEQAKRLDPKFKTELNPGTYEIIKWNYAENGHQTVTFSQKISGYQTWMVWGDDIECDGEPKHIHLKVPYYSQHDNLRQPARTCSSSTHAMILNYLKPDSVASDDEYFQKYVSPYGDSPQWSVHTEALKRFGIESVFRTDLDFDDLFHSLELGYPIVIGVCHKGPITQPDLNSGHVLAIVGMNRADGVFYANDPWGEGFEYTNKNGQGVQYPIYPSLERRWLVDGSKSGWGRLITAVDGKPTGLS